MKLKLIIGSLVLVSLGFGACSKDDDDSAYVRKDEISQHEGSAQVIIKGKSDGGYDLNDVVNLTVSEGVQMNEMGTSFDNLTLHVRFEQDIYWNDNSLDLTIEYNKATNVGKVMQFSNYFEKNIDARTVLKVHDYYSEGGGWWGNANSLVLSNFNYNTEAGVFNGIITYTSNYTNSDNVVLSRTIIVNFASNVTVVIY